MNTVRNDNDELRDRVAKAIADAAGHGMREKCVGMADAAIQACHAAMQGEDVRDAERYRYIRKGLSEFHGDVYGMAFAEDGDYPVSGNDLDKHVDAMGERHELS